MADELIEIYNEHNKFLGFKKTRKEVHQQGLWHRASHIWIYNPTGEIILQLRVKDKQFYPDMWDISVAGHVRAGEEPIVAALREIAEEIGLSVKPQDLQFFKIGEHSTSYQGIKNKEFYYIYLLKFLGDISDLNLQKKEVVKIKFFSLDGLERELKIHPDKYVPHGDYWFEMIKEIRGQTT